MLLCMTESTTVAVHLADMRVQCVQLYSGSVVAQPYNCMAVPGRLHTMDGRDLSQLVEPLANGKGQAAGNMPACADTVLPQPVHGPHITKAAKRARFHFACTLHRMSHASCSPFPLPGSVRPNDKVYSGGARQAVWQYLKDLKEGPNKDNYTDVHFVEGR